MVRLYSKLTFCGVLLVATPLSCAHRISAIPGTTSATSKPASLDAAIVPTNMNNAQMTIDLCHDAARQVAFWGPVRQALTRFHDDIGRYPTTNEGLSSLIRAPATLSLEEQSRWQGPYTVDSNLSDPWGNRLRYRNPPAKNIGRKNIERRGNAFFIPAGTRFTISPDGDRAAIFPDVLDFWSVGADGEEGTDDDIGNWDQFRETARGSTVDSAS